MFSSSRWLPAVSTEWHTHTHTDTHTDTHTHTNTHTHNKHTGRSPLRQHHLEHPRAGRAVLEGYQTVSSVPTMRPDTTAPRVHGRYMQKRDVPTAAAAVRRPRHQTPRKRACPCRFRLLPRCPWSILSPWLEHRASSGIALHGFMW